MGDRTAVVFGLGHVGRAFLELANELRPGIRIVGVADSRTALAGNLDLAEIVRLKLAGRLPDGIGPGDLLDRGRPDVVVDAMSCDFDDGEPSASLLKRALSEGIDVVTANKAPLARRWRELFELATTTGATIGYSAAAGAALPAVAVARFLARAGRVVRFEGILTGTTTFVLDEMARGVPLHRAVARAQELGIAEPDPRIDMEGWDTAAKAVILANTLWGCSVNLDDVAVAGVGPETVVEPDTKVRLVALGRRTGEGVEVEVRVREANDRVLTSLERGEKGVMFEGPPIGTVVVAGGRSHPSGAAAALLADALDGRDFH